MSKEELVSRYEDKVLSIMYGDEIVEIEKGNGDKAIEIKDVDELFEKLS